MEIRDIEAFIMVTETGSITASAERLHISQPAVSRRIQRIECELQCLLFERNGLKLILTPAGKAFYLRCISIFTEMKEAVRDAQIINGLPPEFFIGIDGTLAGAVFAKRFKQFCQLHPSVNVNLRTGRSDEISEMVMRGNIDIGIRYFEDRKNNKLVHKEILREKFVVISSPQYNIGGISSIKWITYERNGGSVPYTSLLDRILLINGIDEVYERIKVDSLTAQKRLVEAGLGLAFVPLSGIEEEINRGSLQIIDIPNFEGNASVYALYRNSTAVKDLIDKLIDTLTIVMEDVPV